MKSKYDIFLKTGEVYSKVVETDKTDLVKLATDSAGDHWMLHIEKKNEELYLIPTNNVRYIKISKVEG